MIRILVGISINAVFAASLCAQAAAGYHVTGTLVNALTGEPVLEAEVILRSETQVDLPPIATQSEAGGKFAFNSIPAGRYVLTAKRRGYLRQALDEHAGYSTAVVTGPKLDTSRLLFRLKPAAGIRGRVLDESSDPVAQAQVFVFQKSVQGGRPGNHLVRASNILPAGRFRFSDLEAGTYYLAVMARPWYAQAPGPNLRFGRRARGDLLTLNPDDDEQAADPAPSPFDVAYPLTWFGGATEFASAVPITLTAGQMASADFNLQPVQAVHLHLDSPPSSQTSEGPPSYRPRNIAAFVEGPDGIELPMSPAQRGMGGRLSIDGLAPGHYLIDYFEYDNSGKALHAKRLTVDASGSSALRVDPEQSIAIDGKVALDALEENKPVRILLRPVGGPLSRVAVSSVAADGTIAFTGSPFERNKQYELSLEGRPELMITSVAAEGAKVSGRVLTIGESDVHLKLTVAHGRIARVSGFVFHSDEPAPGVAVFLIPENPLLRATDTLRDQSNTDGSFVMANVMPGSYFAIAIDDGFELAYGDPDSIAPYLPSAQKVSVGAGAEQELKIAAQPALR